MVRFVRELEGPMPNKSDTFSVMEGQLEGYPVVATIASHLSEYRFKSKTPWFLGFSTQVAKPDSRGLPESTEAENLNRWEDDLEKELKSFCQLVFIGRVTWKGNRELLF